MNVMKSRPKGIRYHFISFGIALKSTGASVFQRKYFILWDIVNLRLGLGLELDSVCGSTISHKMKYLYCVSVYQNAPCRTYVLVNHARKFGKFGKWQQQIPIIKRINLSLNHNNFFLNKYCIF